MYCRPPVRGTPVAVVEKPFDFKSYFNGNSFWKNSMVLDTILDTIKYLSQWYAWDQSLFLNVYEKIVKTEFKCNLIFEPVKSSRDHKYKAGILLEQDEHSARLSIVFLNQSNVVVNKLKYIETKPGEYSYPSYLGKLKWTNNTDVIVRTPLGTIFGASINSSQMKVDKSSIDIDRAISNAYSLKRIKIWGPLPDEELEKEK
jgi:hypothetical protein